MNTRATKQIEPGCRARTNEKFTAETTLVQMDMTVIKRDKHRRDVWVVRWDGVQPLQYVHARFIERIAQ